MTLNYLRGFGNEHESEAETGALPRNQFSPQHPPLGLYPEQFSTTAFTVTRANNQRTWFYRIRPSVVHGRFEAITQPQVVTAPQDAPALPGHPLRWDPAPLATDECDFIDSLTTYATNGNQALGCGIGVHVYSCNQSMHNRFAACLDGELLIVPQQGALMLATECGFLEVLPGEISVIPRGMKFKVDLTNEALAGGARGYICENYGTPLAPPERGPVGANGFLNERDVRYPVAAYATTPGKFELLQKLDGAWSHCISNHYPLDVVAWVGTSAPYVYDLSQFNAMNSVTFDHPDPSIFTVLTSTSQNPGTANLDLVVFPPRWAVAENTFRPPWFHRNRMSEFMGMIHGRYEGKASGFEPGGASLHNGFIPHGPDAETLDKATNAKLAPSKIDDGLAFMFESCYAFRPTASALAAPELQAGYPDLWKTIPERFRTVEK